MMTLLIMNIHKFYAKWGQMGKLIGDKRLEGFKFGDYEYFCDSTSVVEAVKQPCATGNVLNYKGIRLMKMFRKHFEVPEEIACSVCKMRNECKVSFKPGPGRPNVGEFIRLTHYLLYFPVTIPLDSLNIVLEKILIDKSRGIRTIKTEFSDIESPIPAYNKLKSQKQLIWKPTKQDKIHVEKLSNS